MNHKIKLVVLTCNERDDYLLQTIQSIKLSDWNGDIDIKYDHQYTISEYPVERIGDSVRGILTEFAETDYDYLFYLEDDTTVNKFISHNITTMPGFGKIDYLNLCDWGFDTVDYSPTGIITGGQGLVLSKKAVQLALSVPWLSTFDVFLPILFTEHNIPLYCHTPSLVQHNISIPSTTSSNNFQMQAINYDEYFRRSVV